MGEHVKLRGETVKLGTCEDLYYTRFEQLKAMVSECQEMPGNMPPEEYLNPAHGWRYRFPFPDEDDVGIGEYQDYDKAVTISVPLDAPIALDAESHRSVYRSIGVGEGYGYNVNARIPCPASKKMPELWCNGNVVDYFPLQIIQQKPLPSGVVAVVLRCGWCKAGFRLEELDEVTYLVDLLRKRCPPQDANYPYWNTIADRVLAGYPELVGV